MIWTFKILLLKYWIEVIHIFISTTVKTTLIRRHREEKQTRKKISSELGIHGTLIRTYPTRKKSKSKADGSYTAVDGPSINQGLMDLVNLTGLLGHAQWMVRGQDRRYCFIEMKPQKNWEIQDHFRNQEPSVRMPETITFHFLR